MESYQKVNQTRAQCLQQVFQAPTHLRVVPSENIAWLKVSRPLAMERANAGLGLMVAVEVTKPDPVVIWQDVLRLARTIKCLDIATFKLLLQFLPWHRHSHFIRSHPRPTLTATYTPAVIHKFKIWGTVLAISFIPTIPIAVHALNSSKQISIRFVKSSKR